MRAQISVEFLLLYVISLSVLLILLSSFQTISDASFVLTKRALFLRSSLFLSEVLKEVCITGEGNVRSVYIPNKLEIKREGEEVLLIGEGTHRFKLSCEVEEKTIKGRVRIESLGERIAIEEV